MCCETESSTLMFNDSCPQTNSNFAYPIIVGDVSQTRAAVALRTPLERVSFELTALSSSSSSSTNRTILIPFGDARGIVSTRVPRPVDGELSDGAGMLVARLDNNQTTLPLVQRTLMVAQQYELQFIAVNSPTVLASLNWTFVAHSCVAVALLGKT